MASNELHVVTGAFGYSGRYIAARLLDAGHRVRTLTNSPNRRNPFGGRVEAYPFYFDQPERLTRLLEGASVLYNTYWVRLNYGDFGYWQAVENTRILFAAARAAGVPRIVHVSITNPSEN
jgi:nucleoside-diphosphate-sugar epimerase